MFLLGATRAAEFYSCNFPLFLSSVLYLFGSQWTGICVGCRCHLFLSIALWLNVCIHVRSCAVWSMLTMFMAVARDIVPLLSGFWLWTWPSFFSWFWLLAPFFRFSLASIYALLLFHTLCRSVYHRCRRAPLRAFISFLSESEKPNALHNMQVHA